MNQSISPYALLKASKPRKPDTVTTAYDLYSSAVQSSVSGQAQEAAAQQAPDTVVRPTAASVPSVPARKTHYISDIQKRHNAALKRSALPPR